jgi:ABC-2 type transport system permease protein
MRTILFILQKEFTQIFRNRTMLPIIFLMPVLQLVVLVFAATLEMKDIKFSVVDYDNSPVSRELIQRYQASPFFNFQSVHPSEKTALKDFYSGKSDLILVIPANLERSYYRNEAVEIQLLINAINGLTAGLTSAYSTQILMNGNMDLPMKFYAVEAGNTFTQIDIQRRFWYNASLNFKHYMVPGILVILVTVIGMFLSALNIVREKEMGTIEQINVTPIRKYQFIIGKVIPFIIIALFDLALGLLIGKLLFDIPMRGSLWLMFSFGFLYLLLVIGFGLLLSTHSRTQQQVMFMTFFFLLVFILMSGIFTPVETMPEWARIVNYINPFAYFMRVNRMILLKGSGFMDMWRDFAAMATYATVVLSVAVYSYRKRA